MGNGKTEQWLSEVGGESQGTDRDKLHMQEKESTQEQGPREGAHRRGMQSTDVAVLLQRWRSMESPDVGPDAGVYRCAGPGVLLSAQ